VAIGEEVPEDNRARGDELGRQNGDPLDFIGGPSRLELVDVMFQGAGDQINDEPVQSQADQVDQEELGELRVDCPGQRRLECPAPVTTEITKATDVEI